MPTNTERPRRLNSWNSACMLYSELRERRWKTQQKCESHAKTHYPSWEGTENLYAAVAHDYVTSTWYLVIRTWHLTNEWTVGHHYSNRHGFMRALWKPRFPATQNCGLGHKVRCSRTGPGHDSYPFSKWTPTFTRGEESASWFQTLASSKTDDSHMDSGSPGCLQAAVNEMTLFALLHDILEES
jgi:hypothetical protein